MDWNDLRFFLAVAESGTLAAAARRLGISAPTATRRIDALERSLGLVLLDRGTRGVALTADGRAIRDRAAPAAGLIDDAARLATALRENASREPIRVSATEPIVVEVLAPAWPALRAASPEIRVDLAVTNVQVSLSAREAEIAVRFARPVGNSLIARRLKPLRFGVFASAGYLAGRAAAGVEPLAEDWIGYDDAYGLTPEVAWLRAVGAEGRYVGRTSSTRGLAAAAAAGIGVALLPTLIARRTPGLVELPPPRPIPPRAAWLVVHRDLARARPVRSVLDWIGEAFASAARQAGAPDGRDGEAPLKRPRAPGR